MENALRNEPITETKSKQERSCKNLLIGTIIFLVLILILCFLLWFTDLGKTVFLKIQDVKDIRTEDQVGEATEIEGEGQDEEEEAEVVALENEGWALYSIPEYGFSVEIPATSEYNEEFDQYMRWEISRSKVNKYSEDSLEQIHLNYYPSGFSPSARDCGQGCNGEIQVKINYYDKDTQYNLDSMKAKKREEIDSWNGTWEDSEDYEEVTIEDYVEESAPLSEKAWCVNPPGVADSNFRECYFEKGEYLIEIVHTGLDLTDFGADVKSSDLYGILDSMKFE